MRARARIIATSLILISADLAFADRLDEQVAPQATTDPLRPIYRIVGIFDDGSAEHAGVATTIHCYSTSNDREHLRIRVSTASGVIVADRTYLIVPKSTMTVSTHSTNIFAEYSVLSPGTLIYQRTANIQATTDKVHCSAMILDTASRVPVGIALRMVRFNPVKNSME